MHTQSSLLPNLQVDLALLDTPSLYPSVSNPISIYQSQAQIHHVKIQQQQQQQINKQILLPYPGIVTNATLHQQTTLIPAPPRALQPEPLTYSNRTQFLTQPINFANTDNTGSSELPQPIHTVSTKEAVPQDISHISDTSNSDPFSSQFSSPTQSQSVNDPFNPP